MGTHRPIPEWYEARGIKFDSDPDSKLNQLRYAYWSDLEALKQANRSGCSATKSLAMSRYNTSRSRLKHFLNGTKPAQTYEPHFTVTISGIPCGIVVESYIPPKQWRQHTFPGAGPGDCDPPQPAEFEFMVIDRKGYPADWLMEKMTWQEQHFIEHCIEYGRVA